MMFSHAQGELLAQVRPAVTTAVQLYKNGPLRAEITLIIASPIEAAAATSLVIYHDDTGANLVTPNEIIFVDSIQANDPVILFQAQHPGSGIFMNPNATLSCKIGIADNINFSVYGITETLAERVRGM